MVILPRLGAGLALATLMSSGFAQTIYVDAQLVTGLNDGSSWTNAFQGSGGLQSALSAAGPGDKIFVAQGTYHPTTGAARTVSFRLKNDVEVYGSFLGGESSPDERPPFGTAPSVLSGDLAGDDAMHQFADNSFHVVHGAGTDETAVLDGFEIRGGNANSGTPNDRGGGIFCENSSDPTVRNCEFIGNRATYGGGAGYITESAPLFAACSFVDNRGGLYGGAFDLDDAGLARFDRCTFEGNTARRGGALDVFSALNVYISNCLIINNTATGPDGGGGLWFTEGGIAHVRNCTIVGNTSTSHAAGGLRVQFANLTLYNSILWDNEGPGGAQGEDNQVIGANPTYCIIEGLFILANNNIGDDPEFLDPMNGDYSLSAASPAIDSGNNKGLVQAFVVDHSGAPRFLDTPSVPDTGVGDSPVVDRGAFEYSNPDYERFCFGDGTGTPCPCGNDSSPGRGSGCAHQAGDGATLVADGVASVSNDSLEFGLSAGVQFTYCILFSGDNRLPTTGNVGAGVASFDGLLCVDGALRSHGWRRTSFGDAVAGWGPGGIIQQGNFAAGQTRHFFVLFRTFASETCGTGLNSSNGVSVTFGS